MTRKKIRRIVWAAIITLLVVAWLCGFISVNVANPPVPLVICYEGGDAYVTHDVAYTLTGHRIMDGDSVKELLVEVDPKQYQPLADDQRSEDIRMVLLDIKAKNLGSEEVRGAYAGVYNADMLTPVDTLSYMFDDVTMYKNAQALGEDWDTLQPGEEKQWTLYFFLESQWMAAHWWAQVDTMPYEFILDTYPVEYRFSTAPEAA